MNVINKLTKPPEFYDKKARHGSLSKNNFFKDKFKIEIMA
jgi:hypothetical protein